jgi:hypothetical protein
MLDYLLLCLSFVSSFLSFTLHLHMHLIEHIINVHGLDTPSVVLILDVNGVVGVSRTRFTFDFRLWLL